ncbi:MAG: hypothetical protein OEW58_08885 [Gammaproteobacteria bacterium]|nr:hypothetical protein [Gammaproteobacteria bacterium]
MKAKKALFTAIGLATLAMAGCNDGGNSAATSRLSMLVQNNGVTVAKPTLVGVAAATVAPITFSDSATTFTITEARMHVRDIRMDTINSDTQSGSTYTVTGPFVMNLLDGSAYPANVSFAAPAGNYQRVDIRLDEANPGEGVVSNSDELVGNALIIKGTHDYNSGGTFTLTVKVTEDIRLAPTNGIVIDSDVGANVMLTYRVTDWLENAAMPGTMINLTSCIADPNMHLVDVNNHITLNEGTQCAGITESIGNLIKNNMKNKYDFSNL